MLKLLFAQFYNYNIVFSLHLYKILKELISNLIFFTKLLFTGYFT